MQKIIMKDYNKNKESSYLKYWDVKNLHGWATSQQLPVSDFQLIKNESKYNEDFIKSYIEDSDEGYSDVQYPEKMHNLHNDLPFFPERMKTQKFEKLVANLCRTHKKFKTSIKLWISIEKKNVERKFFSSWSIIQFFEEAWGMLKNIEISNL